MSLKGLPSIGYARSVHKTTDYVSAAVQLHSCDGRVLLSMQPKYLFSYFGGMPEEGEAMETAAQREVREESGLLCESCSLIATSTIDSYNSHCVYHIFKAIGVTQAPTYSLGHTTATKADSVQLQVFMHILRNMRDNGDMETLGAWCITPLSLKHIQHALQARQARYSALRRNTKRRRCALQAHLCHQLLLDDQFTTHCDGACESKDETLSEDVTISINGVSKGIHNGTLVLHGLRFVLLVWNVHVSMLKKRVTCNGFATPVPSAFSSYDDVYQAIALQMDTLGVPVHGISLLCVDATTPSTSKISAYQLKNLRSHFWNWCGHEIASASK